MNIPFVRELPLNFVLVPTTPWGKGEQKREWPTKEINYILDTAETGFIFWIIFISKYVLNVFTNKNILYTIFQLIDQN